MSNYKRIGSMIVYNFAYLYYNLQFVEFHNLDEIHFYWSSYFVTFFDTINRYYKLSINIDKLITNNYKF